MQAQVETTKPAADTGKLKPTYDTGFWEAVYQKQEKPFLKLIEQKQAYLSRLQAIDLFSLPQAEAIKKNRQIKYLIAELNTLQGMKLFMDDMKDCYLHSSAKIHEAYHARQLQLQVANSTLKNALLYQTDTTKLYMGILFEAREQLRELRNQLANTHGNKQNS